MGNELKRDACPEKYYATGNPLSDALPAILALVVVGFFSGSLLHKGSNVSLPITLIIESAFVLLASTLLFFLLRGMRKRLSETYISVCEYGVCGVFAVTGYKNKAFEINYSDITDLKVKRDRLFLCSHKGNVTLYAQDAQGTADLIRSKITALK